MSVRALENAGVFLPSGDTLAMVKGQVYELPDVVAEDLIQAGYAEPVDAEKPKKK